MALALISLRRALAHRREGAMKQLLLELVRDEQSIPLEARLREELFHLMAAAIVAVHEWEGEASDDGKSFKSEDHGVAPGA